ncbi:hypothetical protein HMPREF1990_02001 [Porphyromonas gingivalis W4087]|nr:hypothetical protein HMPREF1990_02001 [Porphyromonas gingivalis W4087]
MCRERSRAKIKTQSPKTAFSIGTEYIENKKATPNGQLYENNLEKILFSHDIPLSLQ